MNARSLVIVLLAAVALPAAAQTPAPKDPAATPGIDRREARQERRIQQGVESGQLNQKEAARLERGQQRVEKMEAKAKSDGVVTAKERARIQHQQDVQSRHIAREKHDKQTAKK